MRRYLHDFDHQPKLTLSLKTRVEKDQFNDWRGRECSKFVPVLVGNGTKIASTGDVFD